MRGRRRMLTHLFFFSSGIRRDDSRTEGFKRAWKSKKTITNNVFSTVVGTLHMLLFSTILLCQHSLKHCRRFNFPSRGNGRGVVKLLLPRVTQSPSLFVDLQVIIQGFGNSQQHWNLKLVLFEGRRRFFTKKTLVTGREAQGGSFSHCVCVCVCNTPFSLTRWKNSISEYFFRVSSHARKRSHIVGISFTLIGNVSPHRRETAWWRDKIAYCYYKVRATCCWE